MKELWNTIKDPKVFIVVLGMSGTVGSVLWKGLEAQAELKIKKEYDKLLTDYAIQLATCK